MAYSKQVATHSTDDVITAAHLNTEFDYIYGTVLSEGIGTTELTDASVTTAKLGADAVDGTKLADNACDSEHYTDASIDAAHIASDAVTTVKIKNLDPDNYTTEESVTFANSLILKQGTVSGTQGNHTVTFGTAFPTACTRVMLTPMDASNQSHTYPIHLKTKSASNFVLNQPNGGAAFDSIEWMAWGY